MAKKFSELEAKMSPEARARVQKKIQVALAEMPLSELRNVRGEEYRAYALYTIDKKSLDQQVVLKLQNIIANDRALSADERATYSRLINRILERGLELEPEAPVPVAAATGTAPAAVTATVTVAQ
jgi:hypothetical protein